MPFVRIAGIAAIALLASAPFALAQVQIGTLRCNVSGSVGRIITQKQTLACRLLNRRGLVVDRYAGVINSYGLALGATDRGHLIWGVAAPTSGTRRGALAGTYVGASAGASLVAGGGANVLVGGSNRSFSLQPLSVQGQTGVNIAVGVTSLQLVHAPRRVRR